MEFFDELAVMVDTFRPLELGEGGVGLRGPDLRVDLGRAGAGAMTTSAFPAFAKGLCDDAAIFPPGLAPLAEAVPAHVRHLDSPYAELVGPLGASRRRPWRSSPDRCPSTGET